MVTYLEPSQIIAAKQTAAPRFYSASGFGRKIPSRYMVKLADSKWRRVYICQISNAGSAYVLIKNDWHFVNGDVEAAIEGKL